VAVLDPKMLSNTNLSAVLVTMERDSAKEHATFCARMRAAPEVQQCYVLAGEWDYLVLLTSSNLAHYRELAERLFIDEGVIRRYETHMVFEPVKLGLSLPTRMDAGIAGRRLERLRPSRQSAPRRRK